MALATVSGISVPRGCGRILCGEGDRGLAEGGASRVWPCMGKGCWEEGERVVSQPGWPGGIAAPWWAACSLASRSLALTGL